MAATLEGRLNYWTNNPAVGARKLQKLAESEPEPVEYWVKAEGGGRLSEARRHLLPAYDAEGNVEEEVEPALPLIFATEFCLNIAFTEVYENCDFKQGLKGIEYLGNMERIRQQGLRKAAKALGLTAFNFHHVVENNTLIRCWVQAIDQLSPECDRYFSLCYMDLRIWYMFTFIKSYNDEIWKGEAIALINTLFPPDLVVQPNPRITRSMMDHFRRQIYSLLLATINDSDLIHRVITQINDPDPEKWPTSSFRSWTESRNALLGYIELSKRIIAESENVVLEANTALTLHSSELVSTSEIPSMPNLERTLEIAEFLGLGENLDVSKRHIAAVATFSRQMDAQQQKITELENRFDVQDREIGQLKRWASVKRKEGSPVMARPNKSHPAARPNLMEEMLQTPRGPLRVEMDTPTGQYARAQHRREPPAITAPKYGGEKRGGLTPLLSDRSSNPLQNKTVQIAHFPEGEIGLAIFSQSKALSTPALISNPVRTSSMEVVAGRKGTCTPENLGVDRVGTLQSKSPFTESSGTFGRGIHISRTGDQATARDTTYHRCGTSGVRGLTGYCNPLPETPEMVTPLGNASRPEFKVDYFLRSDLHNGSPTSIPENPALMNTAEPRVDGSTQSVKSRNAERCLDFGEVVKESLPSNSSHEPDHGVGFSDSNDSSTTSGLSALGRRLTPRDKKFNAQRSSLRKKPSLARFAARLGFNTSGSGSLFELKAPDMPWTSQNAACSTSEFSTTSSKDTKKDNKTLRIRSRISGRLLQPHELGFQGMATFAASRQITPNCREGVHDSSARLSSDVGASRESIDSRHPRSSIDKTGRPESAMSQNSRQPKLLRKAKSQSSVKTAASVRDGSASPFTPKSPRTPKTSDTKKGFWSSMRSSPSQDIERVYTGDDHEPFPFTGVPTGFHFPTALDNETPEQTANLEVIRDRMIVLHYESLDLKRDGTEKTREEEDDEKKRQDAVGSLASYDDEDPSFMTPTLKGKKDDNEDDKSPLKKFMAAITQSYSPRKPELATWHLNIPQAVTGGSSNGGTSRPQTPRSDYALSSVEDFQSHCFAEDLYRDLSQRIDSVPSASVPPAPDPSGYGNSVPGPSASGRRPSASNE